MKLKIKLKNKIKNKKIVIKRMSIKIKIKLEDTIDFQKWWWKLKAMRGKRWRKENSSLEPNRCSVKHKHLIIGKRKVCRFQHHYGK